MKRQIHKYLLDWKLNQSRKVLLIRGARQVGKTYSVRELGKNFKYYLEINFESDKSVHQFFQFDLNPDEIIRNLSAYYDIPIIEGETLVFFDEIQACIPAISSLRFFYERKPALHLVAAGSLLEFALKEIPSFGVGRIENLFMYPMSFDEFLIGSGQESLLEMKHESNPVKPLNPAFHQRLTGYLKQFLLTGGLPEVVRTFLESGDLRKSQVILDQLIISLNDDFAKYKKIVPVSRIREVFEAVVNQSGNKFNISKASDSANHRQIKEALELLEMAGLIHRVNHTAATGLPLGALVNPGKYKLILFDHGIFQRILKLSLSDHLLANEFSLINKGNLAEQFVGTELIKLQSPSGKAQLFYWHRETRGANAEVDYVIQNDDNIFPIEVKSGTQGKMQSLRIFMNEKKIPLGIRVSLENFSKYENIGVFPLYAVGNLLKSFRISH
ncbi:MAG: ATP-binding protein [Bacteroidales bacterium]|nr:ATP-binding protein [Bacteroidales bacterium]